VQHRVDGWYDTSVDEFLEDLQGDTQRDIGDSSLGLPMAFPAFGWKLLVLCSRF